eukprot:m.765783 g.765783  ORF g.765783 m.765783 type:complete len:698 (-) comp59064_c0_seq16:2032-4125(-)
MSAEQMGAVCDFCSQPGALRCCSLCRKHFHPLCNGGHGNGDEHSIPWKCSNCSRQHDDEVVTVETAKEPARTVETSFSPAKPTRSKVSGPSSALSSFLRESGISVPNHGFQRRPSRTATADATSSQPSPASRSRSRQSMAEVVSRAHQDALAAQELEENLHQESAHNTSSSTTEQGRVGTHRRLAADECAKDSKTKPKRAKAKKLSSDESSSETDSEERTKLAFALCGRCKVRIPKGLLLCTECVRVSRTPKGSDKAKKRKVARDGTLLQEIRGSVSSLQDICVKFISDNFDSLPAFGYLSSEAKFKISSLLCRQRRLKDNIMQLFTPMDDEILSLIDCADLSPNSYRLLAHTATNLTMLELRQCGQLTDSEFDYLSTQTPVLTHLTLEGCFLISDASFAGFFENHPGLIPIGRVSPSFITQAASVPSLGRSNQRDSACGSKACHTRAQGPVWILSAFGSCDHHTNAALGLFCLLIVGSIVGLASLKLDSCASIVGADLEHLATLTRLNTLHLTHCDQLIDAAASTALQSFPIAQLRSVEISGSWKLADAFVLVLATKAAVLEEVGLGSLPDVSNDALISFWSSCPLLSRVNLRQTSQTTEDTILRLLDHAARQITHLSLNGLYQTSSKVLHRLANECFRLQELDVSWCRGVTDEWFMDIVAGNRDLSQIGVWGCSKLSAAACQPSAQLTISGFTRL